jgi:hypothetical protein
MSPETVELKTVLLLDMPTSLVVESNLHTDEVLHELEIINANETTRAAQSSKLADLMREVLDQYAEQRAAAWSQAQQAAEQKSERIDLELVVPVEAAASAERLASLLDEVDELCRQGALLTLPPSPEMVAFRRWALSEIKGQLEQGLEPRACTL